MTGKIRALVLLSGGLDSMLVCKLLLNLGIEVLGITFRSPFWNIGKAQKVAQNLGIKLVILEFEKDYLEILKSPRYGYGSGFNPCIDCHILMVSQAWKYAQNHGFHFVATGEVLGERPMSQNKQALEIVAKESGAGEYLLRPLSAKFLKETIPEQKNWVPREKLLDIRGRSRKKQLQLAKKWGILEFPTPAGGCLLTDPAYSQKLKELVDRWLNFDFSDAEILKHGRVFWDNDNLIVVGRNQEDNLKIEEGAQDSDILLKVGDHPGPTTLVRGKNPKEAIRKAAKLTLKYAHLRKGKIIYGSNFKFDKEIII